MGCTGSPGSPRCPHWGAQGAGLGSTSHIPWPGSLRVTGDLERERCRGCASHGLRAQHCSGSLPRNELFMLSAPTALETHAAMGWCPPADLNTDWQSQCHSSPNSTMPSTCALALLLLALPLPPAPAQQHRGDRGDGPAASPPPRRAHRGQRPPAALPAPSKAGVCPAMGSSPTRPTRRYCLSDHSCPGAEKCCLLRDVRACLLPTAGTGSCGAAGAGRGMGATGRAVLPSTQHCFPHREPGQPCGGELWGELLQ